MTTVAQRTTAGAPAASNASVVVPSARREHVFALDVFRGLTIAGCCSSTIGNLERDLPALRHAPWHGCTPPI